MTAEAVVVETPNARFFPGDGIEGMYRERGRAVEREMKARGVDDMAKLPPANFLAISGGGDDGAFGARLLNGWTETGTRPEFKMVTGVGTGALTAPFAFLDPRYDERLKQVFTGVSAKDIYIERDLPTAY